MKVKARDGKVYDVASAPPGGKHAVVLNATRIGAFILDATQTRVEVDDPGISEELLVDIADRFVALGGAPMGIA